MFPSFRLLHLHYLQLMTTNSFLSMRWNEKPQLQSLLSKHCPQWRWCISVNVCATNLTFWRNWSTVETIMNQETKTRAMMVAARTAVVRMTNQRRNPRRMWVSLYAVLPVDKWTCITEKVKICCQHNLEREDHIKDCSATEQMVVFEGRMLQQPLFHSPWASWPLSTITNRYSQIVCEGKRL